MLAARIPNATLVSRFLPEGIDEILFTNRVFIKQNHIHVS